MRRLALALSVALVAVAAGTAGANTPLRPITIGVTISQTGSAAGTAGYVLQGYQRWVGDVNRNGGLLHRQVQLLVYDDRSDPATSAARSAQSPRASSARRPGGRA